MISYLLATNRDVSISSECIKSIESLAPHDHEIIICAPQHIISQASQLPYPSISWIPDEINHGSTYAFNKGYKYCRGDWIITTTDDLVINIDINRLIFLLNTPEVQQSEYQVYNLGGQWFDSIGRNQSTEGTPGSLWSSKWTEGITQETFNYQYPVISFPLMSRKTVEEKFGGIYFNPCLIHHYVDHWLGAYLYKRVPQHNPNIYSPHACWTQYWTGEGNCIRKYDTSDGPTYVRLLKHLIQENPSCAYGVVV